jgi:hypothetical protein
VIKWGTFHIKKVGTRSICETMLAAIKIQTISIGKAENKIIFMNFLNGPVRTYQWLSIKLYMGRKIWIFGFMRNVVLDQVKNSISTSINFTVIFGKHFAL